MCYIQANNHFNGGENAQKADTKHTLELYYKSNLVSKILKMLCKNNCYISLALGHYKKSCQSITTSDTTEDYLP